MATIAAQVILHPTATQTLKVLGTTVGRDKIYRAAQYFARFFAWFLLNRGHNVEAARWNALKGHLATARKLMRLGKPLEHLQAALKAYSSVGRPGEQLTTIARQLSYAAYLFYDGLVWANSVRFITLTKENAQTYGSRANRFWFVGIIFSIVNGLLKAGRLANESKELRDTKWGDKSIGDQNAQTARFAAVEKDRVAVRYQFVLDMLDVWLPAANLGYVDLNEGLLGMFGLITSLMALRTQWQSVNKAK